MAGSYETTIRAVIKLLVEGGHIPKEVATSIQYVGDQAGKTTTKLTFMGDESKRAAAQLGTFGAAGKDLVSLLKNLAGALGITFAASALFGFIRNAYVGFAELGRATGTLRAQVEELGGSFASVQRFIKALGDETGQLDRAMVPALSRLILAFDNVTAAQEALTLAARFAEAGFGTLEENANAISVAFQTGMFRSLSQFGIKTKDASGAAIDFAKAIDLMREKAQTFASRAVDAQDRVEGWRRAWNGFSNGAGEVADAIVNGFIRAKEAGDNFFYKQSAGWKQYVHDAKVAAETAAAVEKFNKQGFVGPREATLEELAAQRSAELAKETADKLAEDLAKKAKDAANARFDAESEATQKLLQMQIAAAKEGSQERLDLETTLIGEVERYDVEHAMRADAKVNAAHEDAAVQRATKDKEFAEKRAASEQAIQDRILQLEIDRAKDGSDEKYQLEIDAINRRYTAEIKAAEKAGESTARIRLAWERELSNKTLQFIAQRAAAELEATARVIDSERELRDAESTLALVGVEQNTAEAYAIQKAAIDAHFKDVEQDLNRQLDANTKAGLEGDENAIANQLALQNKLLANDAEHAAATKQLAQSVEQFKSQQALDAARTAIGALESVFGKNRAMALAMITIDTALAVMEVWAAHDGSPWYVKLAKTIAIAAIAEKQRQMVMSASPGGGSGSSAGGDAHIAAQPTAPARNGGVVAAAADGVIVPQGSGGKLPEGFKPKGRDTEPFMLEPGEIVTPADDSADVLAGRAVLMAPGSVPKGAPSKRIIGGRIAIVPTKGRAMHAAAGAVAPPSAARPSIQIGGAKSSSILMPQLSGSVGMAAQAAMSPQSDPMLGKVYDKLSAMHEATQESASSTPTNIDNRVVIEGNVYGGDAGARELSRLIDRGRRLDSNRIIR
jgi:hypothetical protein